MSVLENEKKWALDKYAIWENNNYWKEIKIDKPNLYLIMLHSQLLIVFEEVALESLYLVSGYGQIKAFFVNSSVEVKITDMMNKTSKFRVYIADGFKNKSNIENCFEVIEELQKFISVTQHPRHSEKSPKKYVKKRYRELVRELLKEGRFNFKDAVESIMKECTTTKSVQLFLLDPQSKALVNKAQHFLPKHK